MVDSEVTSSGSSNSVLEEDIKCPAKCRVLLFGDESKLSMDEDELSPTMIDLLLEFSSCAFMASSVNIEG